MERSPSSATASTTSTAPRSRSTIPPIPTPDRRPTVGATDFTIEFWIKGALADNRGSTRCGNTYGWIDGNTVIDRDRYNQPRSFGISLGNGRIAFGVNVANNVMTLCGSRNVLDGQWHHVAVTRARSSGTMRLFVDGIADGSATGPTGDLSYPDNGVPGNYCSGSCAFSDPYIVIGAEKHDAGPGYPSFSGFFDELRLSTTLRYGGNFSVPAQPFTVDGATAALYHLDASSGTTVADAAGTSPGFLRVGGNPQGPLWSTDTPFPGGGPGTLSLQSATYTVNENGSAATVTVERTGGSTGSASVTYQTSGGTATPGADYNGVSGTLNWASGDVQPKTFSISLLDDTVDEPDETVGIQLTGSSGASLGTPSAATLTIVDNEATVQHGSLRFSSASYGVGEGGGSINVTVNRINGTDGAVSVNFATGTGTALADSDYTTQAGTLNWAAGDATARVITVPILEDAQYEGTESFTVTLSAPGGGAALASPSTATVSITENDAVPVPGSLQFAAGSYSLNEGAGWVTLTVNRVSGSAGAVSVNFNSSNGTATSGSDFTAQSGTLSWGAGDASARTIVVPIANDTQVEASESFSLTLSSPSGGASLGSPSTASVSIVDNDTSTPPPGALQFSAATYQVAESGGSILITARRVNGSGGVVAVSYATSNGTASAGADYTARSGVLSWPDGDVSDKTFAVSIASDTLAEGNETGPSGGATLGTPSTSVLTIADSTANPGGGFTDAFERPNGAAIGNGWTESDPNAFSLSAGRAAKNTSAGSSGDALVYRPATENLGDVEIAVEMRLTSSNVGYPQIFTRLQTGSLGTGTVVRYVLYVNGMLNNAVLARQNGSSLVTLGTLNLSPSLNTMDTFRLRMRTSGTSPVAVAAFIERNVAGAWQIIGQVSVNDSAAARIASSGSTGFGGFTESTYSFDNFVRTALGAGGAVAGSPPSAFELWPSQAMAGESGLIVVVNGADFTPDSRVRWNGEERATTFVSPTELEAQIDARDLSAAGSASIDVYTPGPGGGLSNLRPFTISPAVAAVRTAPQPRAAQ